MSALWNVLESAADILRWPGRLSEAPLVLKLVTGAAVLWLVGLRRGTRRRRTSVSTGREAGSQAPHAPRTVAGPDHAASFMIAEPEHKAASHAAPRTDTLIMADRHGSGAEPTLRDHWIGTRNRTRHG